MKTVLFAIAMNDLSPSQAEDFENQTVNALRMGSREFADVAHVHCDYKDGLFKMCQQYKPDYLIVNEALKGIGNIFDIVKDIKSELPEIKITVLLTNQRVIGDVVLANLTASGIYNWLVAPWKPESVANTLIVPKKMKDVEAYMPRIVENGEGGLAFETKLVEKIEDGLEDLPDILTSGGNKGERAGNVGDIGDENKEKENVSYHRVMTGGFGFGKSFKPVLSLAKEEPVQPEPVVEQKFDLSDSLKEQVNEIKVEEPKEEAKPAEAKTEDAPIKRRLSLLDAINMRTEKKEAQVEEPVVVNNPFSLDDEPVAPVQEVVEKPVEQEKVTEPVAEVAKPEEVKPVEVEPVVVKEEVKEEIKEEVVEAPKPTLSSIKFTPKFEKILFVRAYPISSVVPAHIKALMNAQFVDFNKASNNDEYFDLLRTTIKEAKMPEGKYIVGDVVAGNGIEKLVEKFDHVVAILPEDPFAIKQFNERYGSLCNGAIVDKCITSSITRKQLTKMMPNVKYIDTIKVDNCNKDVIQSGINHTLLMDNAEFAEGMKFFLRDIGGVE